MSEDVILEFQKSFEKKVLGFTVLYKRERKISAEPLGGKQAYYVRSWNKGRTYFHAGNLHLL